MKGVIKFHWRFGLRFHFGRAESFVKISFTNSSVPGVPCTRAFFFHLFLFIFCLCISHFAFFQIHSRDRTTYGHGSLHLRGWEMEKNNNWSISWSMMFVMLVVWFMIFGWDEQVIYGVGWFLFLFGWWVCPFKIRYNFMSLKDILIEKNGEVGISWGEIVKDQVSYYMWEGRYHRYSRRCK